MANCCNSLLSVVNAVVADTKGSLNIGQSLRLETNL
jgi:hypothetical protein